MITTLLADGGGSPVIELVADRMGISVRTLQRRLRERGLTHTEVVQQARCAAAATDAEAPAAEDR